MRQARIRVEKLAGPVKSGEQQYEERMRSPSTAHAVQDQEMLNDPVLVLMNNGEEPQNLPPVI